MPAFQALNPGGPIGLNGMAYANLGQIIVPVHHSGPGNLSGAPAWFNEHGRTTVQAALDVVRSGRGDVIQILPGHAETITAADAWSNLGSKTGVSIYGPPIGPAATITWGAATTTVLMDTNDLIIDGQNNLVLQMEPTTGTVNVAAPITISGARNKLLNLRAMVGTDSNNKVTIAVTTTAAADDLEIGGVKMFGAAAAEATTFYQFVGADRLYMHDCSIIAATSAVGVGLIRFLTTASTHIRLFNLHLQHLLAASETTITGMSGLTGHGDHIYSYVLDDDSGNLIIDNAKGCLETVGSLQFGPNCFVTNVAAETGAKLTPVSA